MQNRPSACHSCPLHPLAQGFMGGPEGFPRLGVTLMGEALGEQEAKLSRPFIGMAGLRLEKMIQSAGYRREDFQILNAIWCQPPKNSFKESDSYYTGALQKCEQYWHPPVKLPATRVIVPMGNVPLEATLGMRGILSRRGYVEWSERFQCYILPTVHPSYIMRGNSNWEAAFIYDLRHAVEVAEKGWSPKQRLYTLDPSPSEALKWAEEFKRLLVYFPGLALGTDIETPDKSASEDETDINLGYQAGPIYRIGFAYVHPKTKETHVLSIPWDVNFLPTIKLLLGLNAVLVFAYRHFDVPRIKAHRVVIRGEVVDVQESWHTLHSNLPKSLEHIVPYLVPNQPAWKHLSSEQPALYNGIDAGVQVEGWYRVKELLEQAGMWHVYQRHVRELNPILIYMSEQGMPINEARRIESSETLMKLKEENRVKLNAASGEAQPAKLYKRFVDGLQEVTYAGTEKYCSLCGKTKVNKKHPCLKPEKGAEILERSVEMVGWTKPLDFKPSQKGLLRYVAYKGYRVITKWDKDTQKRKPVMDENAIRRYALTYTEDPIFPLVLEERELNKLLGTYVGRLTDEPEKKLTEEQQWHEAWARAQYRKDEEGNPLPPSRTVDLRTGTLKESEYEDDDIPF